MKRKPSGFAVKQPSPQYTCAKCRRGISRCVTGCRGQVRMSRPEPLLTRLARSAGERPRCAGEGVRSAASRAGVTKIPFCSPPYFKAQNDRIYWHQ
jgi:hypothetical protein